jgi:hypothetical protein
MREGIRGDNLIHLLYTSESNLSGSFEELGRALNDILSQSQFNNEKGGLTGALIFTGGLFAQILEGPAQRVEETFQAICRDTRHRNVRVLLRDACEHHTFADWSMGFVMLDGSDDLAMLSRAHQGDIPAGWTGLGHEIKTIIRTNLRKHETYLMTG